MIDNCVSSEISSAQMSALKRKEIPKYSDNNVSIYNTSLQQVVSLRTLRQLGRLFGSDFKCDTWPQDFVQPCFRQCVNIDTDYGGSSHMI
jgi:hypothetical protein